MLGGSSIAGGQDMYLQVPGSRAGAGRHGHRRLLCLRTC